MSTTRCRCTRRARVADVAAVVAPGGLIAAEPGVAGLWVARTFPTPALEPDAPRRVVVPARRDPGVALGWAALAAAAGRPAVVLATAPLDDTTAAVVDRIVAERLPVVVEVWTDGAPLGRAAEHAEHLADAVAARGPRVLEVPVCLEDTERLVAAAGPVVAWPGQ